MTALFHFDAEFTHPSPRVGALMQLGAVIHPFNEKTMECTGPVETILLDFGVPETAIVSDWVKENQGDLLHRCQGYSEEQAEVKRAALVSQIVVLKEKHEKLIPCGYNIGSDYAYLLDVLGEQADLVHYRCLDLVGMGIPLFGSYDWGDKELAKLLGIGANKNEHNALADAAYQARNMIAALKKVAKPS